MQMVRGERLKDGPQVDYVKVYQWASCLFRSFRFFELPTKAGTGNCSVERPCFLFTHTRTPSRLKAQWYQMAELTTARATVSPDRVLTLRAVSESTTWEKGVFVGVSSDAGQVSH